MKIKRVIELIKNNRELIKPHYCTNAFEVDDDEGISIYISTKRRRGVKRHLEQIKRLFKADKTEYIEGDISLIPFFHIHYAPKKGLIK